MKSKVIAIIGVSTMLGNAMEAQLIAKFPGAKIEKIKSISERTSGAAVAHVGMPSFIPGNEDVTIHNFGTKMVSNATKAERNHQWEVLRNPESTEEAIAENLSEFRTVLVQNQATMRQNKMDFAEIRIALAEAETEEDKAAAYAMSHALLLKILA
tara:strand:- start:6072 stop:6536 length:465 start_codon:yes stop_codon:yes gene_type:complete